MSTEFIPVYKPSFGGNEKKYVNECLDTTWISSKGEFIGRFEKEFASYLNVPYATTVGNGTAALHLALITLGIGIGDEVIVPTFTYIASVNAIAIVGATPVFVDSLEGTWNVDPEKLAEKITPKTKAIMVVHLYGAPCEMNAIDSIAQKNNLLVIEDAAEAFGSMYDNRYVGDFGVISTFSFFGNKTITTGEGGMIVAKNKEVIDRAAYLKSQAVSPIREYWHDEVGYNFRMTNICAAIGLAQLEKATEIIQRKKQLAQWYKEELKNAPVIFQKDIAGSRNSYWMISILAENEPKRDGLRNYLKESKVETRPLFHPAHTMPVFKSAEVFPVAESISKRGMNLPSFPDLTREEVVRICTSIKEYLHR